MSDVPEGWEERTSRSTGKFNIIPSIPVRMQNKAPRNYAL